MQFRSGNRDFAQEPGVTCARVDWERREEEDEEQGGEEQPYLSLVMGLDLGVSVLGKLV